MFATFGGATLGGAALGTGPSPVASGLAIRLAGAAVPATWTADALRIAESVDQRAVCDLTLVARPGPAQVTPGTRLDVQQGAVVLFTGTVERTVDAILPGSARAVEIKLTAVDASQIADRRLVTDRIDFALDTAHPTGWRADQVARTLVYSYLAGEGVTAFSTDCGSLVTAAFAFQTVAQALSQLAEATGSFWKIGPTRDLTFGPRTLNLAPRAVVQAYETEVRSTPGLVGYWRLGEATGATTAVDLGPNGYHGTYTGSPTLGAEGLIAGDADTALSCNGSLQGVVLSATSAALVSSHWTIGTWFASDQSTSVGRVLLSRVNIRPSLSLGAAGQLSLAVFTGSETPTVTDLVVAADGEPHLAVGTYTGSVLTLYRDDTIVGTLAAGPWQPTAGEWRVGLRADSVTSMIGRIDETFFADPALAPAEVRALYQAGRDVWTHRPALEAVQVERTRERLRTVQVVRGYTSAVASDTCDSLIPWMVSTADIQFNGPKVTIWPGAADSAIQTPRNAWITRFLDLTVPTRLAWNYRELIRLMDGTTPWDAHAFAFLADADGAGPAVWVLPQSGVAIAWGLTTANCWASVNTPTTVYSLAISLASRHWTIDVTGSGVAITIADATSTVTQSFAAVTPGGGYFGHVCEAQSGSGSFTLLDNLTWPVSAATLYTVTREAGVASVQALEGGTGRYEAIVERPLTLVTSDAIEAEADALVRRFSTPPTIFTFEDDTPGYRAGQLLPVHVTAFGLADDFLIETVDLRLDGGTGRLLTRVQAVSDEQQGLSPSQFWQQALG